MSFRLKFQTISKISFSWLYLILLSQSLPGDSSVPIEFKGYSSIGDKEYFSFSQTSTGHSFWLQRDQTIYGLRIQSFDLSTKTVYIEYLDKQYKVELEKYNYDSFSAVLSKQHKGLDLSFSKNNSQLLSNYKSLIKAKLDPKTGMLQHNKEKQNEFYNLLITNPIQSQVADFITQNSDFIDFEKLMKLEPVEIPMKRDRFNTPGFKK